MTSPPQADPLVHPRAGRVWKILSAPWPWLAEHVPGWSSWSPGVTAGVEIEHCTEWGSANILFHCSADFWCFASYQRHPFLGSRKQLEWTSPQHQSSACTRNQFCRNVSFCTYSTILRWWKMKRPCQRTAKSHWLQQLCLCNTPHSRKGVTLFPSFPFQRKAGKRKSSLYNQQITILSGRIQFLLVHKFFSAGRRWNESV